MNAGLKGLATVSALGLGLVGVFYAVPQIYQHFEPVYLSTGNELFRFVIRLGPIFVLLVMFLAVGWTAFWISLIRK